MAGRWGADGDRGEEDRLLPGGGGDDDVDDDLKPLTRPPQGCMRCAESTAYLIDLGVLSGGICVSFCGYVGAQQIITTLLPDIGALSLGILYSTFAVACIVAPAAVRVTGLKAAIAEQLLCLAIWVATNLWPSVALTVPVTLVLGFGAATFWTAVPTYISTISTRYDRMRAIECGAPLPPLPPPTPAELAVPSLWVQLSATLRLIATDDRLALMVPLFVYTGCEQAFFFSVFGSRLVAPTFGDAMVGTASIGFGVTNVIASPLLGRLTDTAGWTLPMAIGLLSQVAALGVLVAWQCFGLVAIEHNAVGVAAMFAVAAAWGVGDAACNSVTAAMLGTFFPPGASGDTQAAFAAMRLFAALVTGVCFFAMPPLQHGTDERRGTSIEILVPLGAAGAAILGLVTLRARHGLGGKGGGGKGGGKGGKVGADGHDDGAERKNSLGMFNGVYFGVFMLTFIFGNILSGVLLGGKGMHPSHPKVVLLFLVYSGLGVAGFLLIVLFLRPHSASDGGGGGGRRASVEGGGVN